MEENRLIQGRPTRMDLAMLLVLSVRLAATIRYYLQAFAPTNILLRHLRTRGGLKWAVPAALLLVPTYLIAAAITTAVIADGGPGWLNLVALTCIWNAMKFTWLGVLTPIVWVGHRARARAAGRRHGKNAPMTTLPAA